MKHPIGCCTWIFGDAPLSDIARRAAAAGLDGVELLGDWRAVPPDAARDILGAEGLAIYSLTPMAADISHPDPKIRAAGLDHYRGLADYAAALGAPMFSCHGEVGRVRPVTTQAEEDALLVESLARICGFAADSGLLVALELLNRYESHQARSVAEGLALRQKTAAPNLRLLPDAYHMNIEESDPAAALETCGAALGLYHAADSNRGGVGDGHTDFSAQIAALDAIGYHGPIVLEPTAPGPDPFAPDKGAGFRDAVSAQLARSAGRLRDFSP